MRKVFAQIRFEEGLGGVSQRFPRPQTLAQARANINARAEALGAISRGLNTSINVPDRPRTVPLPQALPFPIRPKAPRTSPPNVAPFVPSRPKIPKPHLLPSPVPATPEPGSQTSMLPPLTFEPIAVNTAPAGGGSGGSGGSVTLPGTVTGGSVEPLEEEEELAPVLVPEVPPITATPAAPSKTKLLAYAAAAVAVYFVFIRKV